jgi:hypothetical protein
MGGPEREWPQGRLERDGDGFCFVAGLMGELLDLPPTRVQTLMRLGRITSVCERGRDEDEGRHRVTFFHGSREVRLDLDDEGRILRRAGLDFGARPPPRSPRGASSR